MPLMDLELLEYVQSVSEMDGIGVYVTRHIRGPHYPFVISVYTDGSKDPGRGRTVAGVCVE